jgi:hypothetical protein
MPSDLQANAFKVVSERGVVYLMGRVTDREANRAAEVARTVPGVQKVVRVFELISEAELAKICRPSRRPSSSPGYFTSGADQARRVPAAPPSACTSA